MGCLYSVGFQNGKQYIGVTSHNMDDRVRQHLKASEKEKPKLIFHMALKKYREEGIKRKILIFTDDIEYLKLMERRAIKSFNTKIPNGYNSTDGGDGVRGSTSYSEKVRSRRCKETMATPEYKEKASRIQKEYWTDEKKAEQSKRIKEVWRKPEMQIVYAKRDERTRNKKMHFSDERKETQSKAMKLMWSQPENRKACLKGMQFALQKPERRAAYKENGKKSSIRMKEFWKNNREWMTSRLKGNGTWTQFQRDHLSKIGKERMTCLEERLKTGRAGSQYGEKWFIKTPNILNPFKTNAGAKGTSRAKWDLLPDRFDYDHLFRIGFRSKHIKKMLEREAIRIIDG